MYPWSGSSTHCAFITFGLSFTKISFEISYEYLEIAVTLLFPKLLKIINTSNTSINTSNTSNTSKHTS